MRRVRAIFSVFRCRPCLLIQVGVLLFILLTSLATQAQEREWRFEIEVIVFEQLNAVDTLEESFDETTRAPSSASAIDLITPYLLPDLSQIQSTLPLCHVPPQPDAEMRYLDQVSPAIFAPEAQLFNEPFDFDGYQTEDMRLIQEAFSEYGFYDDLPEPPGDNHSPVTDAIPEDESTADDIFSESLNAALAEEDGIVAAGFPEPPSVPEFLTYPLDPVLLPDNALCMYVDERFPMPVFVNDDDTDWYALEEVPAVISGTEWPYETRPYLIESNSLRLNTLVRDIRRQKNLRPLLHLGWRQEVVFGRDNAPFYRLFAGENYAKTFAADGSELRLDDEAQEENTLDETDVENPEDPLIQRIRQALDTDESSLQNSAVTAEQNESNIGELQEKVSEMWQLGGLFKVYLQNINRVPYLHIDANLDYRAPKMEGTGEQTQMRLHTHNFRQLRRVISKQVHYFDHPLFGMVVQIRRYQRPTPPDAQDF